MGERKKCTVNDFFMKLKEEISFFKMFLCLCLVHVAVGGLNAQRNVQFTQYMYSTQHINPAYAGNKGVFGVLGLYRSQWAGVDGAPNTVGLYVDGPIGLSENVGLGLTLTSDKIGPTDEIYIAGDYSYSIYFSKSILSFGIKGGLRKLNVDYDKLNIRHSNDPVVQYDSNGRLYPVFGLGVYLHDNERWYVGISAPTIIKTTYYDEVLVASVTGDATFYAIGGYVFELSNQFSFKPAILARFVSGAPIGVDLSANIFLDDKVSIGASYRFNAGISNMISFKVNPRMFMGYAYDYGVSSSGFNSVFGGSHEIFLRFLIGTDVHRLRTLRRY